MCTLDACSTLPAVAANRQVHKMLAALALALVALLIHEFRPFQVRSGCH